MGSSKDQKDPKKITNLQTHEEPYVTTTDLAEYWRVSRKQIYKQIDAGTLKAIRLGPRLLRISTAEAARFEHTARMAPPENAPEPAAPSHNEQRPRDRHEPGDRDKESVRGRSHDDDPPHARDESSRRRPK